MSANTVPEEIQALKPKDVDCVVRRINGNYYVYENSPAASWEPGQPVSSRGLYIGRIRDGMFLPGKNYTGKERRRTWRPPAEDVSDPHAGAADPDRPAHPGQLERLDRRLVCRGKIVDLYQDTVRLPDGKLEKWDYVHHRKGCGACVVPVLPDGRILMVQQYRPAIGQTIWELPAGSRDTPGEDLADTAQRELEEETGYTSVSIEFLCRIRTAVAWCNEYTEIYLARDIYKYGEQHLDEAEDIRIQAFNPSELLEMIRSCEIEDGKTVAGIMSYLLEKNGL